MKTLQTTLLASSFLFVTYIAVPTTAEAGGWRCQQFSVEPTKAEKKTNDDTDIAIDVARHGLPVRAEVEDMQTSVAAEDLTHFRIPNQCVIQEQLEQELADLYARAAAFRAHEAEVRQTQYQIVLGRYERAILGIRTAWKSGEIAEDIAIQAMYTMRVDAFDYLESLEVVSIRERLQEAISELIARGMDATDRALAVQDTFRKLYELRVESALAVMKARVGSGDWNKYDLQRIHHAVQGLQNLLAFGVPYTCDS